MRFRLFLLLAFPFLAMRAFADPAEIKTDISRAPECEAFATKAKALCEEWYPKINEILFAKDHPLPYPAVVLEFRKMNGVAHTSGNKITISAEWVTKKAPNDYGMVIHELTHVVQDYGGSREGWATEGIGDYIRDKHFEPGARKLHLNPNKSSYRDGYNNAAAFLIWLEKAKDSEMVRKLNATLKANTYKADFFEQNCGQTLDDLWKQFVEAQTSPASKP